MCSALKIWNNSLICIIFFSTGFLTFRTTSAASASFLETDYYLSSSVSWPLPVTAHFNSIIPVVFALCSALLKFNISLNLCFCSPAQSYSLFVNLVPTHLSICSVFNLHSSHLQHRHLVWLVLFFSFIELINNIPHTKSLDDHGRQETWMTIESCPRWHTRSPWEHKQKYCWEGRCVIATAEMLSWIPFLLYFSLVRHFVLHFLCTKSTISSLIDVCKCRGFTTILSKVFCWSSKGN